MSIENLRAVLEPRSIAVIGASTRNDAIGHALFANVLLNGFSGVVYPVNMTAKSVLAVKAYPSVLHIPDEVDLAVVVVPAVAVPEAIAECGEKGVKGVVVISAGFSPTSAV